MANFLGAVIENLFKKPATRPYPFTKREPFKDARGLIKFDGDKCVYCGACSKKCPAAAIRVERAEKALYFEPFKCVTCGFCVEVCPKDAINQEFEYRKPDYSKSIEKYGPSAVPAPAKTEAPPSQA
ncbi:MAG: 4Fe-4S binding protein [Firmicutes bacterium]|nr:4Fe-4S binding protein [Bacillota bacterium]